MIADNIADTDYIFLDSEKVPDDLKYGCRRSEFQYIPKDLSVLEADISCGGRLPDFMYDPENYIPLISDRLKNLFDDMDIRNLFYRRVKIIKKGESFSESYWLAVPPRIDCIDYEKSVIDELFNETEILAIDEYKTGNYEIFKVSGAADSQIIVTEKLKNTVEKYGFTEGFVFFDDENLI